MKTKVETYTIKGWKGEVSGVILKENADWILINEIETDYLINGYAILNKKYLSDRRSGSWEKQVALVLKLKGHKSKMPNKFKFGSIKKMLDWVERGYDIVQFQDAVEDSIEIGVVDTVKKNNLDLIFIKENGKIEKKYIYRYKMDKIRKITFGTDYLKSINLLALYVN